MKEYSLLHPKHRAFIFSISLYSVAVSLLLFFCDTFLAPTHFYTHYWLILTFFISLTLIIHFILIRANSRSPKTFITSFLAITGLKLLFFLLIIGVYAFINKQDAMAFSITFLFIYFLYSLFEIAMLLKTLKKEKG